MEKKHFGKFVLIPPPLDDPAGNMCWLAFLNAMDINLAMMCF
jgi:hypothetical protein